MLNRDQNSLVCTKCGEVIQTVQASWEDSERWAAVRSAREPHICGKKLCSGYGFFPGGDVCPGCADCDPNGLNKELVQRASNLHAALAD